MSNPYGQVKHGHDRRGQRSPELRTWHHMIERCYSKTCKDYVNYGGRGITVCERWLKFENFWNDMGVRPEGCSLDRIDVNGNYEPSNCRWATKLIQSHNTRRNKRVTINGETRIITEWLKILKVSRTVFYRRVKKGQTYHEALGVTNEAA